MVTVEDEGWKKAKVDLKQKEMGLKEAEKKVTLFWGQRPVHFCSM